MDAHLQLVAVVLQLILLYPVTNLTNSGARSCIILRGTPCLQISPRKHLAMVLAVPSGTANTSGHFVK